MNMWFRRSKEVMETPGEDRQGQDQGAIATEPQADGADRAFAGEGDAQELDQDTPSEDVSTQERDPHGPVSTRTALLQELQEAREQVVKLETILALDDETIELFLGTERYL